MGSNKINIKTLNQRLSLREYEVIEKLTNNLNKFQKEHVKKTLIDEISNDLFDEMFNALSNNEEIRIKNFGTFSFGEVASRVTKHPRTGSEIKIPKTKIIRFKYSKKLKNVINMEESTNENE